jgi:hypothetical protein
MSYMAADLGISMSAPSRIRTCDLLLRRHFRHVAERCCVGPDIPSSCIDSGWEWPGVAQHLPLLAPQLAPHDLVSLAKVRMLCSPRTGSATADTSAPDHAPCRDVLEENARRVTSLWRRPVSPGAVFRGAQSRVICSCDGRAGGLLRCSAGHADVSACASRMVMLIPAAFPDGSSARRFRGPSLASPQHAQDRRLQGFA